MIKITETSVCGIRHAIRGMRNPMNSWDFSDSVFEDGDLKIGENDLKLMKKLAEAGSDHGKFMRMIVVYCDIEAPLYWWKEFDTYKVGTVANSCSTMHKLGSRKLKVSDFSTERLSNYGFEVFLQLLKELNIMIVLWQERKEKRFWDDVIQLLPTSYNQKRTVMLNYAVLKNIYHSRKNHKLDEWHEVCRWIESLPYSELIVGEEKTAFSLKDLQDSKDKFYSK